MSYHTTHLPAAPLLPHLSGVGAYSVHPGWATTEGVKSSIPGFYSFYKDKFRDVAQGTDGIVWLALQVRSPEGATESIAP